MSFIDTSDVVIKQMRNSARRACRKIAKEIAQNTVENAPMKRGYIRKSMKYGAQISSHTGQASGTVGFLSKRKLKEKGIKFVINPAWLEFGTKSHYIKAGTNRGDIKKRGLANRSSGKVFGKSVVHPGAKKVPFLGDSARKVAPDAVKLAENELKILNEINDRLIGIPDDGNDDI